MQKPSVKALHGSACACVCVLHIPLCTSQSGNVGKSYTESTGQSEDSSPDTRGGVCTNMKIMLGLCRCA